MADTTWIWRRPLQDESALARVSYVSNTRKYPATSKDMEVRTADAAVCYLNVDVCFFPCLGLEFLPDHITLVSVLVEA